MGKEPTIRQRWSWALIPPWLVIGAAVVLVPLFVVMTMQSLNRQRGETTRLLLEKGEALIRSFEAGARTGAGLHWDAFRLQKLLIETAQQPGVDYFIITDATGLILADSDPSRIGDYYGGDLDLIRLAAAKTAQWRQVANAEGADTFEVYRGFVPTSAPFPIWQGGQTDPKAPPGLVIFVGLDMGPVLAARKADEQHTIWMAAILVFLGLSGVISLLLAQGYKATKKSLSQVQAFSAHLMENMPMGLVAIDPRGVIKAFNKTAAAILAIPETAAQGRPATSVLPPSCEEVTGSLAAGRELVAREIVCLLSDGRTVPLEIIASRLHSPQGELLGTVILFRDISELRTLQEEISRTKHLAALGSLAAGVAHEIRNPLSSIKGFATYFRDRYGAVPDDKETAEIMIGEVERLNRVIGQLLEFARPTTLRSAPGAIAAVIEECLKIVAGDMAAKGIVVQEELPALPDISYDRDKMKQVFLNLFLNALAAMEQGGVLTVAAKEAEGKWIQIVIADTGTGIATADLERIFDPYFTTKPAGTGLGLAIVQKIVTAHRGEIKLESEPGKGTQAIIRLPIKGSARDNMPLPKEKEK